MTGRRYIVVMNPQSGRRQGPAVLDAVRPLFAAVNAELDVRISASARDVTEFAATADLSGCAGFCVVGGDGTVHDAVNGLMRRTEPGAVPLGVIPSGTGNSLAEHIACADPLAAARRIIAGKVGPLDVVRVSMGSQTAYCINIVGWGCAVDINRTAERLRLLGMPRYTLAALWHVLRARRRRAQVVLDGRVLDDSFLMVVGCNTKFTGKRMKLAPRADVGDGELDLVIVRRATRLQMLRMFHGIFDGSHVALPCVEYHRVRSFAITPHRDELLNLDGELRGGTPVAAEIMPAALRLFTA